MKSITLRQFAGRRYYRNNDSLQNPRDYFAEKKTPDAEDYFCWRWSLYQFPNSNLAGEFDTHSLPTDSEILDTILESRELQSFLLQRKLRDFDKIGTSIYPRYSNSEQLHGLLRNFLWHVVFEIYGDYPQRLAATWSWLNDTKAAREQLFDDLEKPEDFWHRLVSVFQMCQEDTMKVPKVRSFWKQIWEDVQDMRKPENLFKLKDDVDTVEYTNILKLRPLRQGLQIFLEKQYLLTLKTNTQDRIDKLKLGHSDPYHDRHFLSSFINPSQMPILDQKHLFTDLESYEETLARDWNPDDPSSQTRDQIILQRQAILLSVAGSGKSQRLFDYLSVNLGHYFVSGRVPSDKVSPAPLLDPHRGLASQDTKALCDVVDSFRTRGVELDSTLWRVLFRNRQITLSHILEQNKTEGGSSLSHYTPFGSRRFEPHDWLVFQTLCTQDFDPFLKTFKILLLIECLSYFYNVPCHFKPPAIFCLDEMQCEITDEVVSQWSSERLSRRRFQPLDWFLRSIPQDPKVVNTLGSECPFIGAGTSLQFLKCKAIFSNFSEEQRYLPDLLNRPQHTQRVKPVNDLPVITSDDEFHILCHTHIDKLISRMGYLFHLGDATKRYSLWNLLAPGDSADSKAKFYELIKSLLQNELNSSRSSLRDTVWKLSAHFKSIICCDGNPPQTPLSQDLSRHSLIFRGRIRWSVLLIESTLMTFLSQWQQLRLDGDVTFEQCRGVMQAAYSAASTNTQQTIMSQLKARIEELKVKGHHFLVKDLYQTAVRAHLLHRPTIFQDTESAQMLVAGFASLKSFKGTLEDVASLEQELAEPIVVRAVIEHLKEQNGRHEKILRELIFDNQDDASTFGKVTEYYLGWAFGGLLTKEDGAVQIAPHKRQYFLDKLKGASAIPRSLTPSVSFPTLTAPAAPHRTSPTTLDSLEEYALEQCNQYLKNDIALGSPLSFNRWIRRIRERRYFPTFYFPSNAAGPDIVFCLQHQQNENERLLCAIQVKTGTTKVTAEDSFKVVRTLDPNLWFEGQYQKQRKRLIKELRSHGSHLQILTILVVTSLEVSKFFAGVKDLEMGLARLQDPVCRYNIAFEEAVLNTEGRIEQKNAQKEYEGKEKAVQKVVDKFLSETAPNTGQAVLQCAKTVITREKGPNIRARKEATIIRQALTLSQDDFSCRLLDEMDKTGIPDSTARATITQFIAAYNEREIIRNAQKELLHKAKEGLEKTAATIGSGRMPGDQHAASGRLSRVGVLDFFFTVLEPDDLKMILEEAFDELVGAMKGLERRKDARVTDSSESEGDEEEGGERGDRAETGSGRVPTGAGKKRKVLHSDPSADDDVAMF